MDINKKPASAGVIYHGDTQYGRWVRTDDGKLTLHISGVFDAIAFAALLAELYDIAAKWHWP